MIVAALLAAAAVAPPRALPDCAGKPVAKPREVVLACADANFGIRKLRWSGWGRATARATGTAYANDCTPYCAAGHFHTYRAVLVASGRRVCHGVPSYARVRISFPGRTPYPKAKPADLVYPRRCG
ncbi:MAG TPA: hypothetical protein VFJ91_06520 [Gaiellaceae bacterium]|nr:hypothetical protein [Gaiellaceae bacterium]